MGLETCFFRTGRLGYWHYHLLKSAFFQTLMIVAGILSLLGSLVVAAFVWRRWGELGVMLGPRGWASVIIVSIGATALAVGSGIWALREINSLSGPSSVKSIIACLLDAVALAILMAFVIVAYFLRLAI